MDTEVTRADWLLLFLSSEALGLDGTQPLDPIRIQKGMFLLSIRGPKRGLYLFKPYNWGPFSADIYSDLRWLEDNHLIACEEVPTQSRRLYRPTVSGLQRAKAIADRVGVSSSQWLAQTRHYVTVRSFTKLLADIYAMYPEYATKSLLNTRAM